jgi:hypothetical protein
MYFSFSLQIMLIDSSNDPNTRPSVLAIANSFTDLLVLYIWNILEASDNAEFEIYTKLGNSRTLIFPF